MKLKTLHLLLIIPLFFACNNKKAGNTETALEVSTSVSENSDLIEKKQQKSLFDLIRNKKEKAYDLPKDFDFSKNYTEKELKELNLDPAKINANEYYFLSEQKFLKDEVEGLSFQIYYKHFYGYQLEKILRVQKADTIFDITLAGKYSNGSDDLTLSTQFINNNEFREVRSKTQMVKDDPHFMAYYIDSLFTFYKYNNNFFFEKNIDFATKWYKEISTNPETGKQDTLIEKINSLGKIGTTEFFSGVSYMPNFRNLPETITIYSKNKNSRTKLETIENAGAYIDSMKLFTLDKNHFVYIKMMETSGNSYSYFFAVDTNTMTLNKVEQDYGNSKFPDTLQIYKGFGITREADNKFTSGGILRSENGRSYYFENEHKMTKENGKFILKCIDTKINSTKI